MYPTLSDLLNDIFGVYIPLPIHTFGLMVAVGFLSAAYILNIELKRKERQGLVHPITKKVLIGEGPKISELLFNGVIWFFIGYKLIGFLLNYSEYVAYPQEYILSSEGSWLGGILAALAGLYMRYHEKNKQKLPQPKWKEIIVHPYQLVSDIIVYAAIGGLIGAKIFHNLEYIDDFMADPIGSLLSFSGLTFYGGLLGGAIAVLYFAKQNKIGLYHVLDVAAPALMLGYAIGRVGCHVSGDGDWGIVNLNDMPAWLSFLPEWVWSYNYPHNVINEGIPILGCEGMHCYALEYPVYPTPFYESVISFILFGTLMFLRKRIATPGVLFSTYLILNGIERFFIEKIRVNSTYHLFNKDITQAEIISFCLVIVGIAGIIYLRKKNSNTSTSIVH